MKTIRIGCGAGYSGDRIDPAVELAEYGAIDYLVFECLAERTIALAQQSRRLDPLAGYDPLLAERMHAVLPICRRNRIRIVSNMGAANPIAAAQKTREIAVSLGLHGLRIAAVTGDDVLDQILSGTADPANSSIPATPATLVSANAYLGVEPILEALDSGADVILTGRVADPSLFLAPLIHEFRWPQTDWDLMGQGTLVGHLLECAGQVTGGYFADPGYKDVPNLTRLGFPFADVAADGVATLGKVAGSGGRITLATCKEQLFYEVQDPAAYLTPDVSADFSQVTFTAVGEDAVRATGGRGNPRPQTLKVSVGYRNGFVGEGQISYAGPGALARAKLARDILAERLRSHAFAELRFDFIGVSSIHGESLSQAQFAPRVEPAPEPPEVRLRAVGRAETHSQAAFIPREVEALYTNGPAGGGGVAGSTRETIAMASTLLDRTLIQPQIHYEVS
jgi:hypothetical protein